MGGWCTREIECEGGGARWAEVGELSDDGQAVIEVLGPEGLVREG